LDEAEFEVCIDEWEEKTSTMSLLNKKIIRNDERFAELVATLSTRQREMGPDGIPAGI